MGQKCDVQPPLGLVAEESKGNRVGNRKGKKAEGEEATSEAKAGTEIELFYLL